MSPGFVRLFFFISYKTTPGAAITTITSAPAADVVFSVLTGQRPPPFYYSFYLAERVGPQVEIKDERREALLRKLKDTLGRAVSITCVRREDEETAQPSRTVEGESRKTAWA